jgi:hypothetical protein
MNNTKNNLAALPINQAVVTQPNVGQSVRNAAGNKAKVQLNHSNLNNLRAIGVQTNLKVDNKNKIIVILDNKDRSKNQLSKNTMNIMIFPSIDQTPLGNLHNSIIEEKEMRKELKKKSLNIKNPVISASEALSNKNKSGNRAALANKKNSVALNFKVKRVKVYAKKLTNATLNITTHPQNNKASVKSSLMENHSLNVKTVQSNTSSTITNLNNKRVGDSVNGPMLNANALNEQNKGYASIENIKPLPSFTYLYSDIHINDSKEGILKDREREAGSIVNLNKYLKTLTSFNVDIAANQTISFKFVEKIMISMKNLYKILVGSLNPTRALLSQPYVKESANEISIKVLFYLFKEKDKALRQKVGMGMGMGTQRKYNTLKRLASRMGKNFSILRLKVVNPFLKRNQKRLKLLCENLSQIFKKKINIELNRVYLPTSDSQILATAIGSSTKKTKYFKIKKNLLEKLEIVNPNKILDKTLFKYNSLYNGKNIDPANLTGVNVRVAGRLVTEKVIPRKTVRTVQIGSLARTKADIVKTDRYTKKNKRGCFSVTVKTGHFIN